MAELIGVKSPVGLYYSGSLKREALLFDMIAVPQATTFVADNRDKESIRDEVRELEWLLEQGVVFEPEPLHDNSLLANKQFRECVRSYSSTFAEAYELFKEHLSKVPPDLSPKEINEKLQSLVIFQNGLLTLTKEAADLICQWEEMHEKAILNSDYLARMVSIQLRELNAMDAHPIIDSDLSLELDVGVNKTSVIEILLNSLPVPDDSVPWEQIFEYRDDPDTRGKFLALRRWMNKVVREQFSTQELQDEIEFLIHDYQSHLKFHRMKVNFEMWRTIVMAQAEFIPNLIKLKWGKIAESFFALKQRKFALMELEMNAPGGEVAYIVDTRNAFE